MAIIKVGKGGKSIRQAIKYASKDGITYGKDVSLDCNEAIKEMKETKKIYDKTDGRQYKHYIQSFSKKDNINEKQALEIAYKWANQNFKGFEVFIGIHTHQEHLHTHFIVNSVNFENGTKFHKEKTFLQDLKNSNDLICSEYGVKELQKTFLKVI